MRGKKKRKAEGEALAAAPMKTAVRSEPGSPSKPLKPPKSPVVSRRRRSKGPARQTRLTRLVGLLFCLAGFVAIGIGWAGAASKDCVPCQMPYVLSGGALGLGLLVFGAAMMVMAQLRTEGRRLAERLDSLRSSAALPGAGPGTNGSAPTSPDEAAPSPSLPTVSPEPAYSLPGEASGITT